MKIIIIFFSRTRFTESIALQIKELLESKNEITFLEISERKKYHFLKLTFAPLWNKKIFASSVIGSPKLYYDTFFKKKPKLEEISLEFDEYDYVFFGTPIWYGRLPPAVNSFFEKYKSFLSNKKTFIFLTSGSGKGFTNYIDVLKTNIEKTNVELIGQLHKKYSTYLTKEEKDKILKLMYN